MTSTITSTLPAIKRRSMTKVARGFVGLVTTPTDRVTLNFTDENGEDVGFVSGILHNRLAGRHRFYIDQVQVPVSKQGKFYGTAITLAAIAEMQDYDAIFLTPPSGVREFEDKLRNAVASQDFEHSLEFKPMDAQLWMHFYATWGTV